eukprot:2111814-Pleurochrysis_carterae.AAC.1
MARSTRAARVKRSSWNYFLPGSARARQRSRRGDSDRGAAASGQAKVQSERWSINDPGSGALTL